MKRFIGFMSVVVVAVIASVAIAYAATDKKAWEGKTDIENARLSKKYLLQITYNKSQSIENKLKAEELLIEHYKMALQHKRSIACPEQIECKCAESTETPTSIEGWE